jgi:uncharacterized membrane protein
MINGAHLHLMMNHFPVVGIMGALLLLVYARIRNSEEVKMVSLGIFVLLALITIPVYISGGFAEDAVNKLSGVTEKYISRHADFALYALILMEALGILALTGLVLLRRSGSVPTWILNSVLVLSLATTAVIGFTANLGGQIRHTEIRDSTAPPLIPGQ